MWPTIALTGRSRGKGSWSGDCGDVSVVEVDRLAYSAAEHARESGEDDLSGDRAARRSGRRAQGDAHVVGDLYAVSRLGYFGFRRGRAWSR